MSMSKTTNTYNRQNWEDTNYPILCETCLGDIPYVRMIKERHGKDCKICERPFTIFRWCPGNKMRFKKSEICQTCASLKNVCQTCLLDLEYGLPTQVRDTLLNVSHTIPQSVVNKEYYTQNIETEMKNQENGTALAPSSVAELFAANRLLTKLARTSPYYKRNRPHICSFWVKGNCARGEACPYRHEKPQDIDDPLIDQNIKDRYYGRNDPVADKILTSSAVLPNQLRIPEDINITTLYIGNIDEHITETALRDNFYQFGEIRKVTVAPDHRYAFLQFTNRASAELAAEKTFNNLILGGRLLTIKWAHSQGKLHQQNYQQQQLQQIEVQNKQQLQLNNYGLYQSQQQHSQRLTKLDRYQPVTSTTMPAQPKLQQPITSSYFNL